MHRGLRTDEKVRESRRPSAMRIQVNEIIRIVQWGGMFHEDLDDERLLGNWLHNREAVQVGHSNIGNLFIAIQVSQLKK